RSRDLSVRARREHRHLCHGADRRDGYRRRDPGPRAANRARAFDLQLQRRARALRIARVALHPAQTRRWFGRRGRPPPALGGGLLVRNVLRHPWRADCNTELNMAKHYVFEDLEQLADALESLAATLRHLGQSAREDAQHAEIERLLEHLQGSEVDFADVKALGSD